MVHNEVTVQTTELRVEDSGRLFYDWSNHGLKLVLPAKNAASYSLKIVSSDKLQLPADAEQISPLYWVKCEGDTGGPVDLEVQHSAEPSHSEEQLGLKFAVCKMEKPSCTFELHGGQFSMGPRGRLELHQLTSCLVTIVRMKSAVELSPLFLANLYYQQLSQSKCLIHFLIVPRQEAWEKVGKVHIILP